MLVSAFYIDYKLQIIPNRLTLTMLEAGFMFSIIRGISNLNGAIEMWIGMVVGAGIFLLLTFVGNLIFRKETMGFGDVKIMGALRFIFWMESDYSSNNYFIFYSSNIQHNTSNNQQSQEERNYGIYSIWTIYSASKFCCNICTI